jgi:putative DNA primase/helicase
MLHHTALDAEAWVDHAAELAQWCWTRLVNRIDVWGGYNALADRDRIITQRHGTTTKLGSTRTRPTRALRGKVLLTPAILEEHFRAIRPQQVVGLHTTSTENTSLWGAADIDNHGETSTPGQFNVGAALAWYSRLRALGFNPLLTDSNGMGGYHLLTIFAEPVPTGRVFSFLKWLTRDHRTHGIVNPIETFPKQATIQLGRYGNWLRLPGRHHTREHWSRVWDGRRWLDRTIAVDFILALTGDAPALIPRQATMPPPPPAQRSSAYTGHTAASKLSLRIEKYLAKLPTGLGEGQHRDDYAFRFACFLARDLAMPDSEVLPWLCRWDALQAAAKGEDRLREILGNAKRYGQRAVGSGLGPTRSIRHGNDNK